MTNEEWRTVWIAVGAIGSILGAIGAISAAVAIYWAVRRLRFDAWLKAQDVFTNKEFTDARARLFSRLENRDQPWSSEDKGNGLNVCRKMEELAALADHFPEKTILREWGDPIAKAWVLLKPLVEEERQKSKWESKWHAFEQLGTKALRERAHLLP